jgi:hypothetical protein
MPSSQKVQKCQPFLAKIGSFKHEKLCFTPLCYSGHHPKCQA